MHSLRFGQFPRRIAVTKGLAWPQGKGPGRPSPSLPFSPRARVCAFQAWPYFLAFLVLENLVLWLEHKPLSRLNDSLTSISHGIFQECGR